MPAITAFKPIALAIPRMTREENEELALEAVLC
jgi:hypothetical protein